MREPTAVQFSFCCKGAGSGRERHVKRHGGAGSKGGRMRLRCADRIEGLGSIAVVVAVAVVTPLTSVTHVTRPAAASAAPLARGKRPGGDEGGCTAPASVVLLLFVVVVCGLGMCVVWSCCGERGGAFVCFPARRRWLQRCLPPLSLWRERSLRPSRPQTHQRPRSSKQRNPTATAKPRTCGTSAWHPATSRCWHSSRMRMHSLAMPPAPRLALLPLNWWTTASIS